LASVAAPGIFGKNDRPPQLLKSVAPEIPREAIAMNIDGEVTAELEVTTTGTVSKVNILRSSDELFSGAVAAAMKQWVFTPLILNGSPAKFKIRQTYKFRLEP
jgi:TonB family protein